MARFLLSILLVLGASTGIPVAAETAQPFSLTPEMKAILSDLEILRGPSVDVDTFQDQAVIVSFFSSWCVQCRTGFVQLRQLVEMYGADRLSVIAVNWLEDVGHFPADPMRLTRLLDRVAPHITVVVGDERVSKAFGGVGSLPTLFAFDSSGREIFRFICPSIDADVDYSELNAALSHSN